MTWSVFSQLKQKLCSTWMNRVSYPQQMTKYPEQLLFSFIHACFLLRLLEGAEAWNNITCEFVKNRCSWETMSFLTLTKWLQRGSWLVLKTLTNWQRLTEVVQYTNQGLEGIGSDKRFSRGRSNLPAVCNEISRIMNLKFALAEEDNWELEQKLGSCQLQLHSKLLNVGYSKI